MKRRTGRFNIPAPISESAARDLEFVRCLWALGIEDKALDRMAQRARLQLHSLILVERRRRKRDDKRSAGD